MSVNLAYRLSTWPDRSRCESLMARRCHRLEIIFPLPITRKSGFPGQGSSGSMDDEVCAGAACRCSARPCGVPAGPATDRSTQGASDLVVARCICCNFGRELAAKDNLAKAPSTMAADAYGVPWPGCIPVSHMVTRMLPACAETYRLTPGCPVLLLAVAGDAEHPVQDCRSLALALVSQRCRPRVEKCEAAEDLASALPDAELEVASALVWKLLMYLQGCPVWQVAADLECLVCKLMLDDVLLSGG